MANPKTSKTVKAHTRYELKDGTYIPGVTTICGLLDKPFLVRWANKLGLEGIDVSKYVDLLADIGSAAHEVIACKLAQKEVPDEFYKHFSQEHIEGSTVSVAKFMRWFEINQPKPILIEKGLVSETYKYGGTLDLYCELKGKKTLIDWKTGSGLYESHKIQLSANKNLLEENGYPVDECRLLSIGRNDKEDTHEVVVNSMDKRFKVFTNLLEIYYLQKELKV